MLKKVVFLDMDGVIVDLGTNINNWFNKHPATPTFFSFRYIVFFTSLENDIFVFLNIFF
jgi:hypothetical protein